MNRLLCTLLPDVQYVKRVVQTGPRRLTISVNCFPLRVYLRSQLYRLCSLYRDNRLSGITHKNSASASS